MSRRGAVLLTVLALLGASCGGSSSDAPPSAKPRKLVIMAATSLTTAFEQIAISFERANPGVTVETSYAGSSTLARQIVEGAPADVFAAADDRTMRTVLDSEKPEASPVVFAENRLTMIVGKGNPKKIARLADLARRDVVLVLCAEAVPCGRFGRESLAKAKVQARPASNEPDVKAVVAKVASGEADAGIAYVTEARDEPRVDAVAIPDQHNVTASYPIVALTSNPLAEAFVRFVRAKGPRETLRHYGFIVP